jgi:hypothetical protein
MLLRRELGGFRLCSGQNARNDAVAGPNQQGEETRKAMEKTGKKGFSSFSTARDPATPDCLWAFFTVPI